MIRHVAVFTWRDAATADQIAAAAAGLDTMPDLVPGILRCDHGDDLQLGPGTADYVLVDDFATVEDYRAYVIHPYLSSSSPPRSSRCWRISGECNTTWLEELR